MTVTNTLFFIISLFCDTRKTTKGSLNSSIGFRDILGELRHELAHYADWYNEYRPHQALDGWTPQDVYSDSQPQAPPSNPVPNSKLQILKLAVSHLNGNKLLPVMELSKAA